MVYRPKYGIAVAFLATITGSFLVAHPTYLGEERGVKSFPFLTDTFFRKKSENIAKNVRSKNIKIELKPSLKIKGE